MTHRTIEAIRREPQHDAHACAWDEKLWAEWPPSEDPVAASALIEAMKQVTPAAPKADTEPSYVIAKSDSVENLYWQDDIQSWGPLGSATYWGRDDVSNPELCPADGFWMPAERAEELEQ